jgi:hypothetical protein
VAAGALVSTALNRDNWSEFGARTALDLGLAPFLVVATAPADLGRPERKKSAESSDKAAVKNKKRGKNLIDETEVLW